MEQVDDRLYYLNRAQVSRELAQRAANPAVAAIHVEFAARYSQLATRSEQRNGGTMMVQAA